MKIDFKHISNQQSPTSARISKVTRIRY